MGSPQLLLSPGKPIPEGEDNPHRIPADRRTHHVSLDAESVALISLYHAWRRARRQKVPSHNQLRLDSTWMDGLLHLQAQIQSRSWRPRRSTCFIATRPKAREIHAPDFADRVVHHWLVPQLEAVYEPRFILSLIHI